MALWREAEAEAASRIWEERDWTASETETDDAEGLSDVDDGRGVGVLAIGSERAVQDPSRTTSVAARKRNLTTRRGTRNAWNVHGRVVWRASGGRRMQDSGVLTKRFADNEQGERWPGQKEEKCAGEQTTNAEGKCEVIAVGNSEHYCGR
jgi:hypothetical protein